ncbi:hypothetical protein GCM10027614_16250 [Micromonospora vulcania]
MTIGGMGSRRHADQSDHPDRGPEAPGPPARRERAGFAEQYGFRVTNNPSSLFQVLYLAVLLARRGDFRRALDGARRCATRGGTALLGWPGRWIRTGYGCCATAASAVT